MSQIQKNYTTGMPHIDVSLADLAPDGLTRIEHAGKKIVVVRTGGQIYAFPDACPHAFWPLSKGVVRDGVLECPGHGWEFDVRTGRCLNAPDHCLTPVLITVKGEAIRVRWENEREEATRPCHVVPSNPAGYP
jgi:nitrite reductase (NADH) small subunit